MIPNEHDLRVEVLTQACTAPYAAVIDVPGAATCRRPAIGSWRPAGPADSKKPSGPSRFALRRAFALLGVAGERIGPALAFFGG